MKPFHGETRPSAGIHVYDEFGGCFACGEVFTLAKLVAHCKGYERSYITTDGDKKYEYDYGKANMWLEEKYNVEKKKVSSKGTGIIRIDDEEDEEELSGRYEMPRIKLAPLKSGKETHSYFFDRGFTWETVKKFMIGWDDIKKRVTIPVFWQDGVLCGIIGRAVLEMKIKGKSNPKFFKVYKREEMNDIKYYIYDKFPVGDTLYPLPHFKPIDDTAILVEGQFDVIWAHQLGFPQFLSTLGAKIAWNKRLQASKQIDLLHELGVKKVILMRDLDEAGIKGSKHDYELLKRDFTVYGATYPEGKCDPQELTKEDIQHMIDNKFPFNAGKSKIQRI